jgi:hypothetical protein
MKLKDSLEMLVRELGYKLAEREMQERFGKAYHDLKYQHDQALRKLDRLNKVA